MSSDSSSAPVAWTPVAVSGFASGLTHQLILRRQHIGPRHLGEPGPDAAQLQLLFEAAAAAPDHDRLRPWRFIVIGPQGRHRLAQAFADALLARDPAAAPEDVAAAREKAYRGPTLILALADLRADAPDVPAAERLLSLGCAVQNLLLAALEMGFASGLSSGRAMDSAALREAFGVRPGEQAICFISLGAAQRERARKPRPQPAEFVHVTD